MGSSTDARDGGPSHTRRMSEIRVNDVSLYYEEQGDGDPILCIHGTGSSSVLWRDAATELGKRGRAIVYDRRGFSRSERPEPFVTDVHMQTDDAAALIDALAATPAIVIGRSHGGEIAVDLALRYPDRVRALALLEGGGLLLSEAFRRWLAPDQPCAPCRARLRRRRARPARAALSVRASTRTGRGRASVRGTSRRAGP
jgi:pimeloyl-ACP methyl ester carboxylesterase